MVSPQLAACAVSAGRSSSAGHSPSSASPANFTTSPPWSSTSRTSSPKQPFSSSVSSSTPLGPVPASRSVSAVKPETSANRPPRRQLLALGLTQRLLSAHKTAGRECRNIAGERERLAAIPEPCPGSSAVPLPASQPGKRTAQLLDSRLGIAVGTAKCNRHDSSAGPPATDALQPSAEHTLYESSRRPARSPPWTGWPPPPRSMLDPQSPRTAVQGCIPNRCAQTIHRSNPRLNATTG